MALRVEKPRKEFEEPAREPVQRPVAPDLQVRIQVPRRTARRLGKSLKWGLILGLVGTLEGLEMKTSWLQSRIFAAAAKRLTYAVQPGPGPGVRIPSSGPYDQRLGYARVPDFVSRLESAGFEVTAQARLSDLLHQLLEWGLYSIYREKTQAGLSILDGFGRPLYVARHPRRVYEQYQQVPPIVVRTLLFIENREILSAESPYRNPAVEWDRLAKAALDLGISRISPSHSLSGGSTLATQIEKLRHSPDGRTSTVGEKFRQMGSASLRAYLDGVQTTDARRQVVCDYLNLIPLAAAPGHGEVSGLGDGLNVWFGADFDEANRLLREVLAGAPIAAEHARAYRQVLALLLALNRPTAYLVRDRQALEQRVDAYLRVLAKEGSIPQALSEQALRERLEFRGGSSPRADQSTFADRKGMDAIRVALLALLGVQNFYELDRLDMTANATLDMSAQEKITEVLRQLKDPDYAAAAGMVGHRLLGQEDPSAVIYAVTVYERSDGFNLLRVQADNYDQPLNMNEGTKLELGSTAKLRTLVSYLEIVAALHGRLRASRGNPPANWQTDPLSRWAADYYAGAQDLSLEAMLEAAMLRPYSASPGEQFYTGGGLHSFANFDPPDNARIISVREAFERSVNLVFIRLMRDVISHEIQAAQPEAAAILASDTEPERQKYLERFADLEGRRFLYRFYSSYGNLKWDEALQQAVNGMRKTPRNLGLLYRWVRPDDGPDGFAAFLIANLLDPNLPDDLIDKLYRETAAERINLADRAYLTGLHPLELWMLSYVAANPGASWSQVLEASKQERWEASRWLLRSGLKRARDDRIRTVLEIDAFNRLHASWKKHGYPFGSLVPSLATAIGSSGDTPSALAELTGIILNGGRRQQSVRVSRVHFAEGTPFEADLTRRPRKPEQVLHPLVADQLRRELEGVVERGTARRALGALQLPGGETLQVGGKTGTGDNRFESYGPGGNVIKSQAVSRTATFVFTAGDRFFGTITAFVPGEAASDYGFTSSLPVQIFRHLAPMLAELIAAGRGHS